MPKPIALQLYTLRHALAQDFEGVIRRVAEIGYVGVQTGVDAFSDEHQQQYRLFQELGLEIAGTHIGLPIDEKKRALLERVAASGSQYVVVSFIPEQEFQGVESIKRQAERLNEAEAIVRQHGLTLCYHNHWWEFTPRADGRTPHEVLREYVNPGVKFEVDVYWAQTGGTDPVKVVRELGERAPLLHIKDGPAVKGQPMTAVGEGKVDIAGVIAASGDVAKWLIVEMDECATDMLEAVEKSYGYLVGKGLARGNKG